MKVFFCGQFLRNYIADQHFEIIQHQISLAGNTFYNGLLDGFVENGCEVTALSYVPKEIYNSCQAESDDKVQIKYKIRPRNKLLRNISEFIEVFKIARSIGKEHNGIILFNVLRLSRTFGGLIASRIYHIPTIAVITDVPGYRIKTDKSSGLISRIADIIGQRIISRFDYYILLSEEMSKVLFLKPSHYAVIEGLYKENNVELQNNQSNNNDFIVMYAGSLQRRYGIMNLIKAIQEIDNSHIFLHIYGEGEAVDEIKRISKQDNRIKYFGTVSHKEILEFERAASLLVNPRPIEDEYVRYSFPSKNMEYLASGVPVLLTALPSLPIEYHKYAYVALDNSVAQLKGAIIDIYNNRLSAAEKAESARHFILTKKNPKVQVKRILDIVSEDCKE